MVVVAVMVERGSKGLGNAVAAAVGMVSGLIGGRASDGGSNAGTPAGVAPAARTVLAEALDLSVVDARLHKAGIADDYSRCSKYGGAEAEGRDSHLV